MIIPISSGRSTMYIPTSHSSFGLGGGGGADIAAVIPAFYIIISTSICMAYVGDLCLNDLSEENLYTRFAFWLLVAFFLGWLIFPFLLLYLIFKWKEKNQ